MSTFSNFINDGNTSPLLAMLSLGNADKPVVVSHLDSKKLRKGRDP